ncbi:hypothetical protein L5M43_13550 [Shewanella sp. SW36]|uniref:hypothetical protein n=1 Tax=unclassified Shewanella TaxID=196818 RepID=UPI0021D8FD20|nr:MULTISPECIES: hypothetical protein [unclassified Shewanella]MCU7976266.1 hypothetical protein [Shewanella sp. SW36]MCU7991506.1 hypothetical protein [Shewanella sp. SW1]MCU8052326.1 hypothetical protein [Shewanella sp. SM43]
MKNQQLLKSSIESLKLIQIELHDDIDSSKRLELEKVIKELESCETEPSPRQLLTKIGKVIVWIPAIERFINLFLE